MPHPNRIHAANGALRVGPAPFAVNVSAPEFSLPPRVFLIRVLTCYSNPRFLPPAYTSLLRITTAPPTIDGGKEGKRVSTSTIDHPLAVPPVSVTMQTVTPALETTLEEPTAPAPAPPSRSLR